jgi:alkanesulfonate monooxygenase SsuD/methylene tetrahydromethanopterin reductase-like flavin-dependent oxidoreductase (luciferase family)
MGMQLGVVRPIRTIHDMAQWGKLAEDIGFRLVASGDSQTMWMDPYIALSQVAAVTSKVKMGPFVTVPRTRHPSVAACSIGTLHKLSRGRAYYAIGPGDSAIHGIGEPRVKMAEVEEYATAVRALTRREEVTYKGRTFRINWDIDPVPLWMAGDGPKNLEMAGRVADGVVVGNGATVELVEFARKHISVGAEQAGRSIDDLEIWYLVPTHIVGSREEGIHDLRFYLASYAKVRFRYNMESKGTTISPELGERIRGFLSDYKAENQFRMDADDTNMLLDKYDLTEWLAGQRLITGSVDEVLTDLRKLYDAGATNIVMPQMLANVLDTTKALAPIVEGTSTW